MAETHLLNEIERSLERHAKEYLPRSASANIYILGKALARDFIESERRNFNFAEGFGLFFALLTGGLSYFFNGYDNAFGATLTGVGIAGGGVISYMAHSSRKSLNESKKLIERIAPRIVQKYYLLQSK